MGNPCSAHGCCFGSSEGCRPLVPYAAPLAHVVLDGEAGAGLEGCGRAEALVVRHALQARAAVRVPSVTLLFGH